MNRISEFLQELDGSLSFKRLQTLIFTILFSIIVMVNLFTGKTVSDSILELLTFLMAYGYTGIVIEKFSKRGVTSIKPEDEIVK